MINDKILLEDEFLAHEFSAYARLVKVIEQFEKAESDTITRLDIQHGITAVIGATNLLEKAAKLTKKTKDIEIKEITVELRSNLVDTKNLLVDTKSELSERNSEITKLKEENNRLKESLIPENRLIEENGYFYHKVVSSEGRLRNLAKYGKFWDLPFLSDRIIIR